MLFLGKEGQPGMGGVRARGHIGIPQSHHGAEVTQERSRGSGLPRVPSQALPCVYLLSLNRT